VQLERDIRIQTLRMGKDYVFIIEGGISHIGAVGVNYEMNEGAMEHLIEIPGHKEGMLIKELLYMARETCKASVTIIAGIHFEDITQTQIAQIILRTKQLMKEELRKID
jgi:hypothetical protein